MNNTDNWYQVTQTTINNQVHFVLKLMHVDTVVQTYYYRSHDRISKLAWRWMQTGYVSPGASKTWVMVAN